jgi:NADPH-dependent 2,4-dienoyl-CoA reductase/sulfur reductase-like enzyme
MDETFDLDATLRRRRPRTALVVGAGYIGLEMAEALTARGIRVIQVEQLPEVLPTVDPELGALVHTELVANGVEVITEAAVTRIARAATGLQVEGTSSGRSVVWSVDLVLVVVGVRPDTELLTNAGAQTGARGAVLVDDCMATTLPQVWAAGDCVVTSHRQLGHTYLPLGTTAHKQGRVAGANAVGIKTQFKGIVGTQVVKVFELVIARTGLCDHEAVSAGHAPVTVASSPNDHKAYYPTARPIAIRITGDVLTGQLLGAQLAGRLGTEIAKRVDTYATALHHNMTVAEISDLDLSYSPPLGSPWDGAIVKTCG